MPRRSAGGALLVLLAGCAATPGPSPAHDPWEPFNRAMFTFNDRVDRAVLKPTAEAYRAVVPSFVRSGVGNVFSNIDDVVVTINDLLQLNYLHAAQDATRVLINTTIGIYGLFDVARHLGLRKRTEDFGQTLGSYGVGSGPYLVLPIFGPSTLRDAGGRIADARFDPLYNVRDGNTRLGALALKAVDLRAGLLSASSVAATAALDEYTFIREAYLQRRRRQIEDGLPTLREPATGRDPLDELDALDAAPAPPPPDELDLLLQNPAPAPD